MANISNVKVKRGNKLTLSGSSVEITGSVSTSGNLVVGGKITADEYSVRYVTSSVILQSGSTKFGDDAGDTHEFTGSVLLSGALSASALSASSFVGGNASFTTLSASAAELSGNVLIYGTASLSSNPTAAYIVYNSGADKLVVFPGLVVSGNISTTGSVSASTVSGTFSGSGALLNNLTASNINNFTGDVRSLFSATGGITYDSGSGQFSSSLSQGITNIVAGNNIGIVANGTVVTASLSSSVTGLTNLSSSAITGSDVLVNSSLVVNASLARTRVTVNAGYVIASTDQIVLASITGSGDLVVTLPAPTAIDGRELVVKRVDDATQTGAVVISSSNGGTIDSSDTFFELNGPFQSATLLADSGSNKWFVI